MATCGLAAMGLAVAAAVRLAARLIAPGLAADLLGRGTAAVIAVVWFVLPWLLVTQPAAGAQEPCRVPPE